MNEAGFWSIIEEAKAESAGDLDKRLDVLYERLSELSPDEIKEFDKILQDLRSSSYTHELWAACYILNGGCSDDRFECFRGWLISEGKDIFYNAMRDPETLGDLDLVDQLEDLELEQMNYVGRHAYKEKTGQEITYDLSDADMGGPTGKPWNEDDVHERFPRLAALAAPLYE